jgi:NitT/TauT family transport system substrate-binding protein
MCVLRYFKLLILLGAVLLISACSEEQYEPLTIASSPWPGYEPLYLARDLGYFNDKVKLFELPSSDITMESFRNGSTDIASLTLDEVLDLLQHGTKLRILLIMDISNGGDAVMAEPDIKKLSDIKGKRISVVNIPLGIYILNRLLDKAGVKRNEVEVFPMPETRQEKFYKAGKADVIITYDPIKTKLENSGMHVLFDSSDIPNEIFDLLVVQEDVYLKRFDEICDVGKTWFKTLDYIKNNSTAAESMGKRLGVSSLELKEMMKGLIIPTLNENKKLMLGEKSDLLETSKKLAEIMLKERQLSKYVDASNTIDEKFIGCIAK